LIAEMKPGKLAISDYYSSAIDPKLSMMNRKSTLRQPFSSLPVVPSVVSSTPTSSFGSPPEVVVSTIPVPVGADVSLSLSLPLGFDVASEPDIDESVVVGLVIVEFVVGLLVVG